MTTQPPTTSSQKKPTSRTTTTTTYLTIALLAIAFFCFATTTADALFSSPHHRRRQHHMLNDMMDMAGGLNHRGMYRPHAFAIDFDRIESRFEQIQRQHQAHMQQAFKNMQFAVNDDGLLHDVFNIDKLLNDMVAPPHHINNKKKQIQQQQQQQKQQIPAPPATATADNTTIVTPPVVQEQQNVTQQATATNTTVNEYPRHVTYHVFGEFEVPAIPVEAPAAATPALTHDNSTTTATATATDVTPSVDASTKPTAPVQDDLVVVDHDNEDQLSDDVIQGLYGKEQENKEKEKDVAQSSGDVNNKAENSTAIATPTAQTKRFTKRHALSYTFQFTSPVGNVLEEDLAQWDAQVEKFVFEQNARLLKEHATHPEDPVLELRYTRDVHDVTPQQIEYYKQQALYEQERKAAKEQAIARYNARQEQYKKNMEEYKKKEAKRQEELKKQQEELKQVEQELKALDEQKQKLLAKRNKVVNKPPQLLRQNAVRYNRVPAFTPTFFMF